MAATSPDRRETVYLVPHTHWDREWYEPFQRFRLRLVDLLDDVLARAEGDPDFCFTLDGQMAAVDDHLDVRPEDAARVTALVESGQLAVGPWEILLDEFLCSGEAIVRNLERGLARAAAFGTPMQVGYLPDMFGHCAQMPQILAGAGMSQACLWRGVPSTVDSHSFRWEAPDGTPVRCEYLPHGYGNAAYLLSDEQRLDARAAEFVSRIRPWYGDDPILAMFGTDHSAPLPALMARVRSLAGAPVQLQVCTLVDYLALLGAGSDGLPVVRGELRSHARANILPGVISVRVHLKQAMARAERMVERYAEPWAALWSPADQWPAGFLDMAWRRIVASSCHDSVTGCGVDETAVQVAARIAEAEQLGQAVRDRVVSRLALDVPSDGVLVLNPSPAGRSGLVTVAVPELVSLQLPDGRLLPVQRLGDEERILYDDEFAGGDLREAILRRSFGQQLFDRRIQTVERDGQTVTFQVGRIGDPTFDVEAVADNLHSVAAPTDRPWRLRILAEPLTSVLVDVPVDALGWTTLRPSPSAPQPPDHPVRADEWSLDNGFVHVLVASDGTLSIIGRDGTALTGVGRLVDGGDAGDTYNYAPPAQDRTVDVPGSVHVSAAETGPLLAALIVDRTYAWPLGLTPDRASRTPETVPVHTSMRVEVRAGEPFVRLTVDLRNPSDDHRLRLHVPTARPATASYAEGQFAVVERALTNEGGCGEEPLPTFPASGFVDAGGVAVLLDHVTEYEVVSDGREIALTALRSVGQLSRSVHAYREEPAGPELPTPLAQCIGPVTMRVAVLPHDWPWQVDHVLRAAENFRHDLHTVPGLGPAGAELTAGKGLEIVGAAVMTSLRRRGDWLELRLVAESPQPTWAKIFGVAAARRADLLGRPGETLPTHNGRLDLALRAWEIATVQLRLTPAGQGPGR
ncbi:MAG: hypothetical protein ACR2JK_09075 [Geodermatophilaceae bacterium]